MRTMPSIADLLELCKLKVVSLIMLTAVVGMLLAVPYLPNLLLIIAASVGIALSSMSAAVFNHIIDEKIDIIPLPHPSGASPWPKIEPGKNLLQKALSENRPSVLDIKIDPNIDYLKLRAVDLVSYQYRAI